MKILLLGKGGQVGWELQRSLAPLGEVIAIGRSPTESGLSGDVTDLPGLRNTIRTIQPDVIVNASAYTAVDKAESDRSTASLVNEHACAVLAIEAKAAGAWLVHYSTDYVFSGSGDKPWLETDPVGPLNHYGASKLAGERAIVASGCHYLIFRTSWVYSARGNNFIKTILRLARERDRLTVIDDQVGAPTGAELLADVVAQAIPRAMANPRLAGLYHLAASGETSWYGFARFVLDFAKSNGAALAVETLDPIPTSSYPTPAQRPLNSRLSTQKLQDNFSISLPRWENGVTRMLMETLEK